MDIRYKQLRERKSRLAWLLMKSRADALQLVLHLNDDGGPAMFEHACKLETEGFVIKRIDRA